MFLHCRQCFDLGRFTRFIGNQGNRNLRTKNFSCRFCPQRFLTCGPEIILVTISYCCLVKIFIGEHGNIVITIFLNNCGPLQNSIIFLIFSVHHELFSWSWFYVFFTITTGGLACLFTHRFFEWNSVFVEVIIRDMASQELQLFKLVVVSWDLMLKSNVILELISIIVFQYQKLHYIYRGIRRHINIVSHWS